jgi:Uma2 family endonuclease
MALTRQLTLEEFLRLPEAEPALEYFDGVIRQKVSPKTRHSVLQRRLVAAIQAYAEPRRLAQAFPELRTTFADASVVPDVAVYRWSRLPVHADGSWIDDVTTPPDLAIEVASQGQSRASLLRRCRWYVDHGVEIALLVDPGDRSVHRFQAGDEPKLLRDGGRIDLDALLPGFELTVEALFSVLQVRR